MLHCSIQGSTIFGSYVAAIGIVNYLGTELVTDPHASSRKRMQRIERIHQLLDDLDE